MFIYWKKIYKQTSSSNLLATVGMKISRWYSPPPPPNFLWPDSNFNNVNAALFDYIKVSLGRNEKYGFKMHVSVHV